jgi:P4 family phage/plasmid primase-like protien
MPKLTAWPTKFVKAARGVEDGDSWPVLNAREALEFRYDTDAHFVPYSIEGHDQCPRLLKRNVEWVDGAIICGLAVLDLDDPQAHAQGTRATAEFWDSVVGAAEALGEHLHCDVGWYTTRGGGRLLVELPAPVDAETYVAILAKLRAILAASGFVADPLKDWTRCYRFPFVVRDGERFEPDYDFEWGTIPQAVIEGWTASNAFEGIEQAGERFVLPDAIGPGDRNRTLASLAGQLRRSGCEAGEILERLREVNAERCDPPVDDGELERITDSISQYPTGREQADAGELDEDDRVVRFELGDEVEIAKETLRVIEDGHRELVFDRAKLWRYADGRGIWSELSPAVVYSAVQRFSGDLVRSGTDRDGNPRYRPLKVSNAMTDSVHQLVRKRRWGVGHFAETTKGLAFENGFVRADGGLVDHDHRHRATVAVPTRYEPDTANPERWEQTLHEIFAPDDDADQKIAMLYEYIGVGLLGAAPRLQKGLIMVGGGANGKSTVVDVLGALFRWAGTEVAAIPPQEMGQEYNRDMLCGVRLNICSEMPEADILAGAAVKAIIAGDLIIARPIREAPYAYRPEALQVFSANFLPAVKDSSHGFWRRWGAITFNREFSEKERDPVRAKTIIAKELASIAVRAVEYGVQALARGAYIEPGSSAEAVHNWRLQADQVASWLNDRCVPAELEDNWNGGQALYSNYTQWCSNSGHRIMSIHKFGRRLGELGVEKKRKTKGVYYALAVQANLMAL